jgi:hypothetical protein
VRRHEAVDADDAGAATGEVMADGAADGAEADDGDVGGRQGATGASLDGRRSRANTFCATCHLPSTLRNER